MFTDGLFSLGLAGPLLVLVLGHLAIGLLFSGAAIVHRLRSGSEPAAAGPQRKIDWAIAILAASGILSIVGATFFHFGSEVGIWLFVVGLLFLWPVSAVLAIVGRGVGRVQLFVGHGLIALLVVSLVLAVWIHGLL
jgi:hypothetical protein